MQITVKHTLARAHTHTHACTHARTHRHTQTQVHQLQFNGVKVLETII